MLAVLGTVVDRLALTVTPPFAQLIALRSVIGVGSVGLALLLLVLLAISRRRPDRPPAGPSVLLAAALLITGAVHLGTAAARGVVNAAPTGPAPDERSLTIMTLNAQDGAAPGEDVVEAASAVEADVVALAETSWPSALSIADLLGAAGMPMQVFSSSYGGSHHRATSLLVSDSLGRYSQDSAPDDLGFLRVVSVDGQGPPLVGVHVIRPGDVPAPVWVSRLTQAVNACREAPGTIVAGDFNATLDHGPMRRLAPCVDAAAASERGGAGAYGTWHTAVPALLGAPIDHVLVDGDVWRVTAAGVTRVGLSDHRALLVRLDPVARHEELVSAGPRPAPQLSIGPGEHRA